MKVFPLVTHPTLAAALCAGLALSHAAAPAKAEGSSFDGSWTIQLVTQSGLCDAHVSAAVTVTRGQVNTREPGVTVSGQIGSDGAISLAMRKGVAQGAASGTLNASAGAGTWRVAGLGCSGRWTAQRRATLTAQAN